MSWKKYFRAVSAAPSGPAPNSFLAMGATTDRGSAGTSSKFSSYLPEVYAGHPNRIQRYYQYDDMDRDSDINAALDTIADFCTQSEEQNDEPFEIYYTGEPNETEVSLLKTALVKWTKVNDFRSRLWHMFRSTIKNGDAFFLRDPENGEWLWIDTFMVELVKVDDTAGKDPAEYIIRGLDYNKQAKFATISADPSQYRSPLGSSNAGGARPQGGTSGAGMFALAGADSNPQQRNLLTGAQNQLAVVEADNVIHLSLSVGMDINWPFGASILEPVFKTYKQKELLEDAVIIYRVQRAPERRIFYIDTGSMPPDRAKAHIERIKNEIHQRRIPNRTGGGACFDMTTQVPLLDGRTLSIAEIATEFNTGKENWVYSCDPKTGQIVPGKITWAGKTRFGAKVVRLTLDNGETITVTPDHNFPIWGRGKTQAKDIVVGVDSLMSFNNLHIAEHMKIVGIESLQKTMDVGTITVDGKEELHDFHTFALDVGVFTFNSILDAAYSPLGMLEDYYFAQGCISLHTTIPLLDGRTLTLADIISEFEAGKINYLYSQNMQTNEFESGKIAWAGVTQKNAEMVRVTLDNGEYVDLTPDHRFIMRDGSEVRAEHLKPGDSLMPLYRYDSFSGKGQKKAKYERILSNATGKKNFTHLLVQPKPAGRDFVVHHIDFDSTNNNPDNLVVMTWKDHEALHKDAGTYSVGKQWSTEDGRAKMIAGMRSHYDSLSDEQKQIMSERNRNNGSQTLKGEYAGKIVEQHVQNLAKVNKAARLKFTPKMFDLVANAYNNGLTSLTKILPVLRKDKEFQSVYKEANIDTFRFGNQTEVGYLSDDHMNQIVATAGYKSWGDFKNNNPINHKVVSVERLTRREDTGDITVESASGSHVFAIGAGIYIHNSDGRGSKVETLPGGEMTGEIGDLLYFAKKIARGLRIPTSYLALGGNEEAGQGTYNDGKLGAAMIQEFRFNKYCMRIQSLLAPKFDHDFKWYLRKTGIEIDESLFELRFLEPQNFTKYRQIELDAQQVQVYTQLAENKRLSERFKLKRFLNLTDEELIENEKLWSEENAAKLKKNTGTTPAETPSQDLSSVGVRSGGGDFDMGMEPEGEEPPPDETGMPPGGSPPAGPGGAAAPMGGGAGGGAPPAM